MWVCANVKGLFFKQFIVVWDRVQQSESFFQNRVSFAGKLISGIKN